SILAPLSDTPIQRQHKDSVVLNDDLTDMSYRGWEQEPRDHAMIHGHPEIFSSFYSVPTPHLEHGFLKEFRDFLLSAARAFRRLRRGRHRHSGVVVDVFQQGQRWRTENGISFLGGDRSVYYARGSFAADFLRFVRLQYIPAASSAPLAIAALVDYEAALLDGDRKSAIHDESLTTDGRPHVHPEVDVIEVPADYQEIVRRLRQRRPLDDIPDHPVKLAIRKNGTRAAEARQLTPLSARLLALCDGALTVEEIVRAFRQQNETEVPGVSMDKLCLAGIEMLR